MGDAGRRCEVGGADVVLICTNLMHKVADAVDGSISVPLLHIADAVAAQARAAGWTRLGLLGARWVMEETFYADRLAAHGISVVTPDVAGRDLVDRVIFEELTQGRVEPASRDAYAAVVADLAAQGAEAVILGCTEIGLLLTRDRQPAAADRLDAGPRAGRRRLRPGGSGVCGLSLSKPQALRQAQGASPLDFTGALVSASRSTRSAAAGAPPS